jgi:hypothetical protein
MRVRAAAEALAAIVYGGPDEEGRSRFGSTVGAMREAEQLWWRLDVEVTLDNELPTEGLAAPRLSETLRAFTTAHWRTLGNLARCCSLPRVTEIQIVAGPGYDRDFFPDRKLPGDEGVAAFAAGLSRGCLPSLEGLGLGNLQIGPRGAALLGAALTSQTVPSLRTLDLSVNQLGDAGVKALLPLLPRSLVMLWLFANNLTDACLAALFARPPTGVLRSLEQLSLEQNSITDKGCGAIASAMQGGALPALREIRLGGSGLTRASIPAQHAIKAELIRHEAEREDAHKAHQDSRG